MSVVAILQARMSSSRLPGKVLTQIMGKPMLELQIERVQRSNEISRLVVATSDRLDDNPIEELCRHLDINCYRGSLENVLDRYYQAAVKYSASSVVRLTGDCPLADPGVIDSAICLHNGGDYDYTSNTIDRTWPQGLDVEVVRFTILDKIWHDVELPSEKEHVTLHITSNQEHFQIGYLRNETGNYAHLRWTVDQQEDLSLVQQIYETLRPVNPSFGTDDILDLIAKRPELTQINANVDRQAGQKKSYARDRQFLTGRAN